MHIEEVQAALADKIESMGRQTLTLDIPEYEDVKKTFQVLLSTIEERDRDILVLQQHISQMAQSMANEQDKVELLNARVNLQEEKMKILEVGTNTIDVDVGVLIKESSRVHMSRVASPGDQLGAVFAREDMENIEDSLNNSVVVSEPEGGVVDDSGLEDGDAGDAEVFEFNDHEIPHDYDESAYAHNPSPTPVETSVMQLKERVDTIQQQHVRSAEEILRRLEEIRCEAERHARFQAEAFRDRLLADMAELRDLIQSVMKKAEVVEVSSPQTSSALEESPSERDGLTASDDSPLFADSAAVSGDAVHRTEEAIDSSYIAVSGDAAPMKMQAIESHSQDALIPMHERPHGSQDRVEADKEVPLVGIIDTKATVIIGNLDELRREMMVALVRRDFEAIQTSFDMTDISSPGDFSSFMSTYHILSRNIQQLSSLNLSLTHATLGDANNKVDEVINALSNEIKAFISFVTKRLTTLISAYDISKHAAPLAAVSPVQETAAIAETKNKLDSLEAKFEALFSHQDTRLGQLEVSQVDSDDLEHRILAALKDRTSSRLSDTVSRKDDFTAESLWKMVQPMMMQALASEMESVRNEMVNLKDISRPTSPKFGEPTHMISGISRKDTHEFEDETDFSNLMKDVKALKTEFRNVSGTLSQMKLQVKKAMEMAISKSAGSAGHDGSHDITAANITPMRRKSLQRSTSLLGHSELGDSASEDRAHQISPTGRLAGPAGITNTQGAITIDAEMQLRIEQELARITSAMQGLMVSMKDATALNNR